MSKVFLVMFGGTPARGELCVYLNAAAGLYQKCEGIQCYPIDKDVESPNYVNTRNLYNRYQDFWKIMKDADREVRKNVPEIKIASVDIKRTEDMFENMLRNAGIESEEESIRYLMGKGDGGLSEQDQALLDVCFTEDEQNEKMKGGYYGKANIGSVTGDILIQQGVYKQLTLYSDIQNSIKAGYTLDVVIVCSSFGGTGASLGINFGEYLKKEFQQEKKFRLHCIYVQPYFSFPDPEEGDKWGMNCNQFYAKSATAVTILGQTPKLIKKDADTDAVFDRFYYLGMEVLDKISNGNSAMTRQDNHIHMVDMLVSLAIEDILTEKDENGERLLGYQYANEGTEYLTWEHMPLGIGFKIKHVCMMRFCEFMLDCMEPLFSENYPGYDKETLIIHLYGNKGGLFNPKANITETKKIQLHNDMKKCFEFCRDYVKYWIELEENSRFGNGEKSATVFFNLDELRRILTSSNEEYINVRYGANSLKLTETDAYKNYERGNTCLEIYGRLCNNKILKGIAGPGKTEAVVARTLIKIIYKECAVENYEKQQE